MENNQTKLLIVDGHNLLFQMFFGMPSRIINAQGVAIQGVVGFVGALNKILDEVAPTHAVVLFDGESNNPRKLIDENYKANREDFSQADDSQNPFTQLSYVYKALDFMQIAHCEVTGSETDDVVASYALCYGKNCPVVISSFDSDYFQLLTDNVTVLRYRGKASVLWTKAIFEQKYGISPDVFADFKAIVGDSADNIKGLLGVGPKTAQKLLQRFKTVQNLCENADEVENGKLKQTIASEKQRLLRNYSLIKLDGSAKMPFSLPEMQVKTRFKTMETVRGIGL